MSTPNGDEGPREGLSTSAIVGLVIFAIVVLAIGALCFVPMF